MPKREKSKRLQVVITQDQDSLLTKTAYQLSNPERLVSKSEVVRIGIEMLSRAAEDGTLSPEILAVLEGESLEDAEDASRDSAEDSAASAKKSIKSLEYDVSIS